MKKTVKGGVESAPSETKMVAKTSGKTKMVKVRVLREFTIEGISGAPGQEMEVPEALLSQLEKPFEGFYEHSGLVDSKNARKQTTVRVQRI
jgi:hypothetical protein